QLEELQNGTRPEQIMAQQALVQQLDASIADLDVTISKSTLQAPFAGVISAKQVDEGTVVGAGQSVIRLLENAIPEARVGMPVSAIDQLNIGDEKTVYLGERPYSATVSSILPEVDAQTRTQTVVLALESAAASQANTGQTVRVNLQASIPTDGMWLPTEALTQGIRGLWTCYVLVPDENSDGGYYTVQSQSVEVVYQDSDRILVRGTLQPNDMVVASGPHRLVPGQLVTPVQP
ncbi:efflux RND transporter periplasmic adaptor subunit, partial [Adonisia turfae]|uniref:efflux RND transporter periplasmic adaptor subunit n=1 Tax=Adonisia turfae TaxID=2950184 RepID=UPI0020299F6E